MVIIVLIVVDAEDLFRRAINTLPLVREINELHLNKLSTLPVTRTTPSPPSIHKEIFSKWKFIALAFLYVKYYQKNYQVKIIGVTSYKKPTLDLPAASNSALMWMISRNIL